MIWFLIILGLVWYLIEKSIKGVASTVAKAQGKEENAEMYSALIILALVVIAFLS